MKKYRFHTKNTLQDNLKKINNDFTDEIIDSKDYIITVKQVKYKRTLKQNSLYWLWIEYLSYESGNSKETIHESFKEKFLEPQIETVFGKKKLVYSTKNLETNPFIKYLDEIRLFIIDFLGVVLPYPDEAENFMLFQEQIELLKA